MPLFYFDDGIVYREGRPLLVTQQGYTRMATTVPKPADARLSGSKSPHHSSSNSVTHSQYPDDIEVGSRASRLEQTSNAAERMSERSHSRSVTVAE